MAQFIQYNTNAEDVNIPSAGHSALYTKDKELWSVNSAGEHILIGPGNIIEITYSNLINSISNSSLILGKWYLLTNFTTSHVIAHTSPEVIYTAPVEQLLIQSISVNQINTSVISTTYPSDIIILDLDNTNYPGAVTGWITYREDTVNKISAGYDWRNVKIRRWEVDFSTIGAGTNYYSPYPTAFSFDWAVAGTASIPTVTTVTFTPTTNYQDYYTFNSCSVLHNVSIGKYSNGTSIHYPFHVFNEIGLNNVAIGEQCYGFTISQNSVINSSFGYGMGNIWAAYISNSTLQGSGKCIFLGEIDNTNCTNISNTHTYNLNNSIITNIQNCYNLSITNGNIRTLENLYSNASGFTTCTINSVTDSILNANIYSSQINNILNAYIGSSIDMSNIILNNIEDSTILELNNCRGNNITSTTIGIGCNNITFNNINSCIIGNSFRNNIINTDLTAVDFSSATHVYSSYTCNIIENITNAQRLFYYDNSNNYVGTAITS